MEGKSGPSGLYESLEILGRQQRRDSITEGTWNERGSIWHSLDSVASYSQESLKKKLIWRGSQNLYGVLVLCWALWWDLHKTREALANLNVLELFVDQSCKEMEQSQGDQRGGTMTRESFDGKCDKISVEQNYGWKYNRKQKFWWPFSGSKT